MEPGDCLKTQAPCPYMSSFSGSSSGSNASDAADDGDVDSDLDSTLFRLHLRPRETLFRPSPFFSQERLGRQQVS